MVHKLATKCLTVIYGYKCNGLISSFCVLALLIRLTGVPALLETCISFRKYVQDYNVL